MWVLSKLNRLFEGYLTRPMPNAAGRMCLYRIIFGLYYLWIQTNYDYKQCGQISSGEWSPILALSWLREAPPVMFFTTLETIMVFSVVLLTLGLRTRTTTVILLV